MLAIFKVCGAIVLIIPRISWRIKEWAYAGFALNLIAAMISKFFLEQLLRVREKLHAKPYQYLISVHSRIELLLVAINRLKSTVGMKSGNPMPSS